MLTKRNIIEARNVVFESMQREPDNAKLEKLEELHKALSDELKLIDSNVPPISERAIE